jgi:hypothetical protein
MIKKNEISESMSDWVGIQKAAKMTGLNVSNVCRNAVRGRLSFRVREGHVYYYRHELENWVPPKMGAPGDDDVRVSAKWQKKIQDLRNKLKAGDTDTICTVRWSDTPVLLTIKVVDGELQAPAQEPLV